MRASYPLRPIWAELQMRIYDESLTLPGYPAEIPPSTGLGDSLSQIVKHRTSLDCFKLRHTPGDFLRLSYERPLLGNEVQVDVRPQFKFFNFVPKSSVILTTNQDGLLHHSFPRVLCLHGCVYEGFGFAPGLDELRKNVLILGDLRHEAAAEWGIDPGPIPWLYLPGDPVSSELFLRLDCAARDVAHTSALVVIGCSFSDKHILEMLAGVIRTRRTFPRTIVIGPEAVEQAGFLRDIWTSECVWPITVGWDSLAKAILRVAARHCIHNLAMLRAHIYEICLEVHIQARKFPLLTGTAGSTI